MSVMPLHWSDCTGSDEDLDRMSMIIQKNPTLSIDNIPITIDFKTPLQRAVIDKHISCVKFLLAAGANPNVLNTLGLTALHFAIYEENVEIVEILLSHGANPNYECSEREHTGTISSLNYLITACRLAAFDMVKLLLINGANTEDNIMVRDKLSIYTLQSPISVATCEGDWQSIKILLLHGAETNIRHVSGSGRLFEDSLPQILFEECEKTTAIKIKILNMFCLFGVNLVQKNRHGYNSIAVLQTKQRHSKEESAQIFEEYQNMVSQPLTLQSLSRIAIYNAMKKKYVIKLQKLTNYLPPQIMDILHFTDV
jgi:ankyrin repeat protein